MSTGQRCRPGEDRGKHWQHDREARQGFKQGEGQKGQSGNQEAGTNVERVKCQCDEGSQEERALLAKAKNGEGKQRADGAQGTAQARAAEEDFASPFLKTREIVVAQEAAVTVFELGTEPGIGKELIVEGREWVARPGVVFDEPRQNAERGECPARPEAPGGQQEEDRNDSGEFDSEGEAGEDGGYADPGGVLGGLPTLHRLPGGEQDDSKPDVVISADAVNADDGQQEHREASQPTSATTGDSKEHGKAQQKGEMDEGCGRVAANGEGEQEQHLEALRQEGIHVGGNPNKAMFAVAAGNEAEVVAHAVGRVFGGEGVGEIEESVDREWDGRPVPGDPGEPGPTTVAAGDRCDGNAVDHALVDETSAGQQEDDQAEGGCAEEKPVEEIFPAFRFEMQGAFDCATKGDTGSNGQEPGEEDV